MARDAKLNKTVIISTKVNQDAAEKFNKAAHRLGMNSGYELVQLVTDCLLRYIDSPSDASADLKRMMAVFDDFKFSKERNKTVGNGDGEYIGRAIYFVTRKGNAHPSLINVEQPFFDSPRYSYNIQQMFTQFISAAFPKQMAQLKGIAREIGTDSLIDAFTYTLDNASTKSEDDVTYHELFADAERDIDGSSLNVYDRKYQTRQRADINGKRFDISQTNTKHKMEECPRLPFADTFNV